MLHLAWQNLRRQPGRFVNVAAPVVTTVLLILCFDGVYIGMQQTMVAYLGRLPGDVVVADAKGSPTLLQSSSRLPRDAAARVRALDGVADVRPLYGRVAWVERGEASSLVYLVGITEENDFGLPQHMVAGRARPTLAEIVVDRVVAFDLGVGVGDRVKVGDATLTVVGVTSDGNSVIGSYAFVARGLLTLSGVQQPSHLFVRAAPGMDPSTLAARIGALEGLRPLTREDFAARNQALTRQLMLPIVAIMTAVATAFSSSTIAIALHNATVERRHEYALLGALGLPARQLYGLVVLQALLAAIGGVAVGIGAAHVIAAVVPLVEPRFLIVMPAWLVVLVAVTAIVVSVLAAGRPVRDVARLDPALVLRV